MVHINLLPWRDELRAIKRKQFFQMLILAGLAAIVTILITHMAIQGRIIHQKHRNRFLESEIQAANLLLAKSADITKQKEQLIGELQIMQALFNERFEVVRSFDTLVKIIPMDVYLTSIARNEGLINLTGYANSNTQVNQLIQNINQSNWFFNPRLQDIKADIINGRPFKSFNLDINFRSSKLTLLDEKKPGAKK